MVTTNYEYSYGNRENLPLPVQMQLSKTPKMFCGLFKAFFEFALNFQCFGKNISLRDQIFLKLLTPKDVLT